MRRAASLALGFQRNFFRPTRHVHSEEIARQKSTLSGSNTTGSPLPEPKSQTSTLVNKAQPKRADPPRPEAYPVHLRGRTEGLIKVAPDIAHIPIDTSLPPLIFPDGTPIHRPSTFRPPYLTEKLAKHLDIYTNDPYVITRSIELFGSPSFEWVANLSVNESTRAMLVNHTSHFLSELPWHHSLVRPLTDAAWAEHLVAMQNSRLKYGPDYARYQDKEQEQATNPQWPSDTPSAQDLGLSWSSSAERDMPRTRRSSNSAYLPVGQHPFPRPKRIDRFYSWDDHLIVMFASPAARRAVLAAYTLWLRRSVAYAYEYKYRPATPVVLPPVSLKELVLRGAPIESEEREATSWAREVGWRPEYRIRPYRGRRNKNHDGDGWYKTEIDTRKRARERKRELEQLEAAQGRGESEDGDLDLEESNLDKER